MKNSIKKICSLLFVFKEKIIKKNKLSFNSFFWKTELSYNVRIQEKCRIINSKIDDYSYIGDNSYLTDCKIGKFCSIASNLNCAFGKHPIKSYVSTHPYFYSKIWNRNLKRTLFEEFKYPLNQSKYRAIIGNDVWIGSGVTLLDGITIGDGAVIGACTLVNKDIPPYAIVVGTPGKIIGYRFDEKEINFLKETQWWNKDMEWINNNIYLFSNIKEFVSDLNEKS